MKIIECEQGTAKWWEAHRGIPTASSFDRIMTPKRLQLSSQCDEYIAELIAQKLLPTLSMIPEGYVSRAMQQGILLEPDARRWYEFEREVEVKQVGFCLTDDERFGASPDALVGDDGALELKCPLPHTHVKYLLDGVLPAEYRCQVHGELLVTGRDWVDFVSYCPGLPPFIIRVLPNGFTSSLASTLTTFLERFDKALEKVSRGNMRPAAPPMLPDAPDVETAQREVDAFFGTGKFTTDPDCGIDK